MKVGSLVLFPRRTSEVPASVKIATIAETSPMREKMLEFLAARTQMLIRL